MQSLARITGFLGAAFAGICALAAPPHSMKVAARVVPRISYRTDVLPILSRECFACHGPDEVARKGGFRLDLPSPAPNHGKTRRALVPGNPSASEMYRRITSTSDTLKMPPPEVGHRLKKADVATLRIWIEQGAIYEKHWSFLTPVRHFNPTKKTALDTKTHLVDYYIHQKLSRIGLHQNPEADKATLLRRVSLDLIGLPPTLSDLNTFLTDRSPMAYEKQVDRLLASPRYGEHWARLWMDLARYADSKGYEKDHERSIWRWRDWVIEAYNDDIPYDMFSRLQLAGDLMPNPTDRDQIATAFHRNTPTNDEGGTDDEEFRSIAVKDRIDTTGQVWMGLTLGCAKCHTHKYDPISQTDYYRLYAIWNQTEDADLYDDAPRIIVPTTIQSVRLQQLTDERNALETLINANDPVQDAAQQEWESRERAKTIWKRITPAGVVSNHGAIGTPRPDGSILVSGTHARTESLTITAPITTTISSFRLDLLKDASLPSNGPGRSKDDQNIVLSEFTITHVTTAGIRNRIKVTASRADFEQTNWPIQGATDGNLATGWAFSPQNTLQHTAVFDIESPISADGTLEIRLDQNYDNLSSGCFAISVAQTHQASETITSADFAASLFIPSTERTVAVRGQIRDRFLETYAPAADTLAAYKKVKQKETELRATFPSTPIMRELKGNRSRVTKLHNRGSFLDQGAIVSAGLPRLFDTPIISDPTRLDAVKWLFDIQNPLTARVSVNRIWSRLFGRGIVETEEDFGTQGSAPSHPELLDDLALLYQGPLQWSQKQLLRYLVTSRTYKQTAKRTTLGAQKDPENRWLAHMPRVRLSAESIRDQALFVSGLLSTNIGGPPVMPPQPAGLWKAPYSEMQWQTASGEQRYRRGLYTYWRRSNPYPSMLTFDAGPGDVCTIKRIRTNTPLQALVTMNDPVYVEAAGALADQAISLRRTPKQQISLMFERAVIRKTSPVELEYLTRLFQTSLRNYRTHPQAAVTLLGAANRPQNHSDTGHLAALTVVANTILNLDEVLMRP